MVEIRRVLESHPYKNQQNIILKKVTCVVNLDKAFLNFFVKYGRRSNKRKVVTSPQNKQ